MTSIRTSDPSAVVPTASPIVSAPKRREPSAPIDTAVRTQGTQASRPEDTVPEGGEALSKRDISRLTGVVLELQPKPLPERLHITRAEVEARLPYLTAEGCKAHVVRDGGRDYLAFGDVRCALADKPSHAGAHAPTTRIAAIAKSAPADKPLLGLRVALDPGHFSNIEDMREGKFVTLGAPPEDPQTVPADGITEGELNVASAQNLAARLRALGATVTITRQGDVKRDQTRRDIDTYLDANPELNARVKDRRAHLTGLDLERRAERLSSATPDIVMVMHFDAERHEVNAGARNEVKVYVPGCFTDTGFATSSRQRSRFAAQIQSRSWNASVDLAKTLVQSISKAMGSVPQLPSQHGAVDPKVLRPVGDDTGVFARNLLIPAAVRGEPVSVYLEGATYNHPAVYPLAFRDRGTKTGVPGGFVDTYAKSVADGLVSFVKSCAPKHADSAAIAAYRARKSGFVPHGVRSACFVHDHDHSHGAPEIGSYGFDTAGMDTSVAPGDDFNAYASGKALAGLEIPAHLSSYNAFRRLSELSQTRTKDLIQEVAGGTFAQGSDERRISDFYNAFMDEAAVEKLGAAPLAGDLAAIADVKSSRDVAVKLAELQRNGIGSIFGLSIEPDDKAPLTTITKLYQGGIGLPDRDFFFDASFAETRATYKKYIATMLELSGIADASSKAEAIYALEEKIAKAHWTTVESRDADKTYNKWSRADFAKRAPGLDWDAYFGSAGVADQTSFLVVQPSALEGIAKLVGSTPVETWRDYLAFRTIDGNAPILSKAFVDAHFAFHGQTLGGTPKLAERWQRGVDFVSGNLGEAVGKLYVGKYFTPETKRLADDLVKNVVAAMGERLAKLTWMAPETKARAQEKLASFEAKIGYPDVWRDYSALAVKAGDLYGNNKRASAFEYQRSIDKLNKPVDRREWLMTPMTVNAYANFVANEIVFPAAILQPPFFDPNADPAVNYGGIGAVIGHEISHHFDDQGRKYDKNGALADWWSKDDVASFTALTKKVVEQFNGFEVLPGMHVNGELTLGENMADLAGSLVAYDAYQRSLGGKPAPVLEGTTGDQRFFLGWAQVWRGKYRDNELIKRLKTDPHSPSSVRAGIVRNLDPWYSAFAVTPGQKMYLTPDERLRVW